MPVAEAVKADREAYPLKRDQLRRMLDQWRAAAPDEKSETAKRIVMLVKVQFKCKPTDLCDDADFSKEFTPDVVASLSADAG